MKNAQQPHMVEHPCRICGRPTKALKNGVIELHPICPADRDRLDAEFKAADAQRRRQENRR
jgi:hypothetical protein